MTVLHVLGSGSRGNCLAVSAGGATLLVDAGFSAREVERRAACAGLALDTLVGIVLTHEHGDHATGGASLARRFRVPVLTAEGTWRALGRRGARIEHRRLGLCSSAEAGPFAVHACPTSHDAAEPLAVVVEAPTGVRIGVAYDLGRPTSAVRYLLRDLTAVVLEANHDEVRLRTCGYPPSVQARIAGSGGHLSNRAAAELLGEICHPGLALVVLAHLSERSNAAADAIGTVRPALDRARFSGALHVALQDEPLAPFPIPAPERQLAMEL